MGIFVKALKEVVIKETAVKPEYVGEGCLVLEPTYKYILLVDVAKWGEEGMTIEDGMFLGSDGNVKNKIVTRKDVLSAVLGAEKDFLILVCMEMDLLHWSLMFQKMMNRGCIGK